MTEILPAAGWEKDALLELAALTESYSDHPISQSLKRAWGKEPQPERVSDVRELPGYGVSAKVDGREVACGNKRLMDSLGLSDVADADGTVVYVAIDGAYAGHVLIADQIKEDAARAVSYTHLSAAAAVRAYADGRFVARLFFPGIENTADKGGQRDGQQDGRAAHQGLQKFHDDLLPIQQLHKGGGVGD